MLKKTEIRKILEISIQQGFDFAEIFLEDTYNSNLKIINKKVISYNNQYIFGVGIRLLKKTEEVYIYTNQVNYEKIVSLILKETQNKISNKKYSKINFKKEKILKFNEKFKKINIKTKIKKMINLSKIILDYDEQIKKSIINLEEKEQKILVANSQGIYQKDFRPYIRCSLTSISKKDKNLQEFHDNIGLSTGLDFFDIVNLEEKAKKVAYNSIVLLNAIELKPQKMTVILNKGSGGVIFHEACGHSLEATAIAKNLSPFCGKLNKKIASELVTAFDNGNIPKYWGKLNIDDEGIQTQNNLLIEKGILKNYLVDYRNGLKINMKPTGSSRRESYKYSPTSRMNSTYIAAGKDKPETIIKETDYGLYAEQLGGGTVLTTTGEFNFMVTLGYLIEKGKLTKPVKGMMLIGYGQDILLKIDRVGNDLDFSQGYCGSISGYVPVDLGQPTIRVTEMIVGGNKKNE
ncbi:MAG: Zn-dependent protease [Candidatus Phytoplasma cynodontis]|uniref:TldD/PmbA family protein n=1 Tax='Cynodon dactylon' phytoplasma TaxID=295320 RepID=UPI001265B529|nr:TldD/PmbA family protein ['Cynodon dactylon' phytoplasma]KAB8121769.1 TldD/PmbA family protein ['Cynodon dactylon' phytoplasma]WIA07845.1 MAG: Zn-dependent protease [Candidatus Phytoplasma cynodontis]